MRQDRGDFYAKRDGLGLILGRKRSAAKRKRPLALPRLVVGMEHALQYLMPTPKWGACAIKDARRTNFGWGSNHQVLST